MEILKVNKKIIFAVLLLPVFLFYFDKPIIGWLQDIEKNNSYIYLLLEFFDPLINFISNGLTIIVLVSIIYLIGKFFNKRRYPDG